MRLRNLSDRAFAACAALLVVLLPFHTALAAATGSITGKVFDRASKDPLPGAIVQIQGTGLGASTDLDGRFALKNVPAGNQTLTVSYVGYDKASVQVAVPDGQNVEVNTSMVAHAVQGETIVVTGQAKGQMEAINQQLAANSIVNIVSTEKMKELPDANLAESIGRLPGISLVRNAGEADQVIVRGLAPKFNEVTIEGVPLSSTNYQDRSIDLSILSDDLVRGVEVSKTLRPDMDADALGGTVNLTLKTAEPGLHYNASGNGGYNNLRDTYKNYKFTGSVSDRYLDDRLGLIALGNIEEKQLPSDQFSGSYGNLTFSQVANQFYYNTVSATLTEQSQTRHRYGGAVILDYTTDVVDLRFFDVYDQKLDSVIQRTFADQFTQNSLNYNILAQRWRTEQWTHSFSAKFKFWGTELPLSVSYTRGIVSSPNQMQFNFIETNLNAIPAGQLIYGDPQTLMTMQGVMDPSTANSNLNDMLLTQQHLTDNSFDSRIDWKIPFRYSDLLSGTFSVGAKAHSVSRSSDQSQIHDYLLYGAGAGNRLDLINTFPFLAGSDPNRQAGIPANPFVDLSYTRNNILGYPIGPDFDVARLINMQTQYYFNLPNQNRYWSNGPQDFDNNYVDNEHTAAAYVMGEFNVGENLTIVPGARYQDEITEIRAYHVQLNGSNQNGLTGQPPVLVESRRNNSYWFPSVNAKYRATDNIQVIGAAYKSLSLPSFTEITPLIDYSMGATTLTLGNPLLRPSTAWNYDLGISYSSNDVGLVTLNFFYKEISDLIYAMQNFYPFYPYPIDTAPADFYDRVPGPNSGYFDATWAAQTQTTKATAAIPMNDPQKAYLRGVEIAWQTHLWYLPGLLSGIVLDVNAAYMSSAQEYPSFLVKNLGTAFRPNIHLFYQTTESPLQDQPRATYNAILGWDYMGFSSRFSVRYQQKTISGIDTYLGLLNPYTDNVSLVDIALKQQIIGGLAAFANATNVNGHIDSYYYDHPGILTYAPGQLPTSKETYGWALRVGLTYNY
ncbi:MAG TPA: TonB-dependent receptor [Bacteroidota bacterium]|nr:TonB-dependent receptor [Bacteroidota bacterium]